MFARVDMCWCVCACSYARNRPIHSVNIQSIGSARSQALCVCVREGACVSVFVCERKKERECVCVSECAIKREGVRVFVCMCV